MNISLTIPLAIIFYLVLRMLIPAAQSEYQSHKSFEQLRKEYYKTGIMMQLIFMGSVIVSGVAFYFLFKSLVRFQISMIPKLVYWSGTDLLGFIFASLISGLFLGIFWYFYFAKIIMGDKFADFMVYMNKLYGIDYFRSAKISSYAYAGIFCITVFVLLNSYIAVSENKIMINYIYNLQNKSYSFDDVRKITNKTHQVQNRVSNLFRITFSDGYIWESSLSYEPAYDREAKLVRYIAERSGIKIEDLGL